MAEPGDDRLAELADGWRFSPYRFITAIPRSSHRDHLLDAWRHGREHPDHALFWHGGGLVHVHLSPFDSEALGSPAATVATLAVPEGDIETGARLAEQAVSWAESRGVRFLQARCDARDLAAVRGLESAGLRYADGILRSVYSGPEGREQHDDLWVHPLSTGLRVARADDEERLVDIGRRIFRNSRFHRDPQAPVGMAERLHESWVRSAARGERGVCLVSEHEGRLAGFFTSAVDEGISAHAPMPLVRMELSAVLPMRRAPTIWVDLLWGTLRHHYDRDHSCLFESRPQIYNLAIVRREDERPPKWRRAEVALHWWGKG